MDKLKLVERLLGETEEERVRIVDAGSDKTVDKDGGSVDS